MSAKNWLKLSLCFFLINYFVEKKMDFSWVKF